MEKTQKMKISRNVILDLLPLYVANEVSEDTRSLFEHYLETDPELSNVAKQLASLEKTEDIPVPLTKDENLKAFRKARLVIRTTTLILAAVISFAFIILTLVMYFNKPGLWNICLEQNNMYEYFFE